ncbi:AraC family transcriptional regulator [Myxococcus sp. K15C18031901]|uniref:AraC family transcriptional regulator n=1 Tax=Myxococcus dinghuensis TaxID=2906761 RepID=UPI0020A76EDD|nr:AraC family transcriptional regulator [Myxococcus dinghuensis]MCP3098811.1 AraC family transcriptional regulator [Myxococcus dinghuensis]
MAFVRAIVLAYERYGVDPHDALRKAQITRPQLGRVSARINAGQFETLSATAMQQLDDEALGWFSRRLPWGTYGMLCRASLGSPSLGVALKRWCRHHRLLTEDVLLSLDVEGATARLVIEERRELGAMREFCLLSSLRYVHGYACWLVNSQLPQREVTFPFPAPAHQSVYPLLFPGPVRFSATRASLCFDAGYLDLPPKRDEPALRTMLQRALPLTVRQYRRDRLLVERVRAHLVDTRGAGATADAVASALHFSVRSLHRQLAQEGTSLQRIKDDVRHRRARELLGRSSLPIKHVALDVGYADEKIFSRAFKHWTGESPGEYRQRIQRDGE